MGNGQKQYSYVLHFILPFLVFRKITSGISSASICLYPNPKGHILELLLRKEKVYTPLTEHIFLCYSQE